MFEQLKFILKKKTRGKATPVGQEQKVSYRTVAGTWSAEEVRMFRRLQQATEIL